MVIISPIWTKMVPDGWNSPKWSRWLKVVQSQSFAAQFIRKRRWIQYLGLDFNALATKDRLQALDEESHAYRFFLKSCHNNISLHKKKNPKSKCTFIEIFEEVYFFPLFLCCGRGVESVKSANFNARGVEITNFRSSQLSYLRKSICWSVGLSVRWVFLWSRICQKQGKSVNWPKESNHATLHLCNHAIIHSCNQSTHCRRMHCGRKDLVLLWLA